MLVNHFVVVFPHFFWADYMSPQFDRLSMKLQKLNPTADQLRVRPLLLRWSKRRR